MITQKGLISSSKDNLYGDSHLISEKIQTNTFIEVPKDLPTPLYYNKLFFSIAEVQHTTITGNKDSLKQIQFVWLKQHNQQSSWIQAIQNYAGTGKDTYLNQEIRETVVCDFQGGNAKAPIVLRTVYNRGFLLYPRKRYQSNPDL